MIILSKFLKSTQPNHKLFEIQAVVIVINYQKQLPWLEMNNTGGSFTREGKTYVGYGGNSVVLADQNNSIAYKVITMNGEKPVEEYIKEYDCLKLANENNLAAPKVYGYEIKDDLFIIKMEYKEGGTLEQFCEPNATPLEETWLCSIILTVITVLTTLKICHRDIKPSNLLVTKDEKGELKSVDVTDFGDARSLNTLTTGSSKFHGTLLNVAPESLYRGRYEKSDVFLLGVMIYRLMTKDNTTHGITLAENPKFVIDNLHTINLHTMGVNKYSIPLIKLVSDMLAYEKERPTLEQVRNYVETYTSYKDPIHLAGEQDDIIYKKGTDKLLNPKLVGERRYCFVCQEWVQDVNWNNHIAPCTCTTTSSETENKTYCNNSHSHNYEKLCKQGIELQLFFNTNNDFRLFPLQSEDLEEWLQLRNKILQFYKDSREESGLSMKCKFDNWVECCKRGNVGAWVLKQRIVDGSGSSSSWKMVASFDAINAKDIIDLGYFVDPELQGYGIGFSLLRFMNDYYLKDLPGQTTNHLRDCIAEITFSPDNQDMRWVLYGLFPRSTQIYQVDVVEYGSKTKVFIREKLESVFRSSYWQKAYEDIKNYVKQKTGV